MAHEYIKNIIKYDLRRFYSNCKDITYPEPIDIIDLLDLEPEIFEKVDLIQSIYESNNSLSSNIVQFFSGMTVDYSNPKIKDFLYNPKKLRYLVLAADRVKYGKCSCQRIISKILKYYPILVGILVQISSNDSEKIVCTPYIVRYILELIIQDMSPNDIKKIIYYFIDNVDSNPITGLSILLKAIRSLIGTTIEYQKILLSHPYLVDLTDIKN